MRGTVLGFDIRSGEGKISGEDGGRYGFAGAEWHGKTAPTAGQKIDFEASGSDALGVYPLAGIGHLASYQRSRIAAALLALFLGPLGVHKFYIGKYGAGIVMLVISLAGAIFAAIPTVIMAIIALIEGIIYLTMSDDQFDETYVRGGKAWF